MGKALHEGSQRGLGKRRKMCGITQHQLARDANVSLNRLVFCETGRADLTPEELERVQRVLRQRARKAMDAVA